MEVNSVEIKDGDGSRSMVTTTSSPVNLPKQKSTDGTVRRKRRRGKSKRKIMKPFTKLPWPERKCNEKRKNRFRKIVLSKTPAPAPFNNNQFLMEIHKPEPGNDFQMGQTPSTRTRDSSFSVDSEENYFYSLPEDEEEFLTKEFSSVYEDAQCERLSNMSKNELIQEYLLLEAKYENLIKRTERSKVKQSEEIKETDKLELAGESVVTEKDTSTSVLLTNQETSVTEYFQLCKQQEDQISELKRANERLRLENENLLLKSQCSSSEDSESDSSSTSMSSSSSSDRDTPVDNAIPETNDVPSVPHELVQSHNGVNGQNGSSEIDYGQVNGHSLNDNVDIDES